MFQPGNSLWEGAKPILIVGFIVGVVATIGVAALIHVGYWIAHLIF